MTHVSSALKDDDQVDRLADVLHGQKTVPLSPLASLIVAVAALNAVKDSRGFAKRFDVAHALVLRECNVLAAEKSLLCVVPIAGVSLRLTFDLTQTGRALVAKVQRT